MNNTIRCVVPAGDICGEGAVWHPEHSALYWTDINRFLVHRFDPASQSTRTWIFDEPVTSVNLTTDPDTLLLVMGSQVGFWSPRNHPHPHPNVAPLFRLPDWPHMRFNDARVDPRGSLWVGTMRNNVGLGGENLEVEFSGGVLYRIDPDGTATEWKTNIGISNTVAWSPDHDTFYFGDTIPNAIRSYRYNQQTGEISAETPLLVGHAQGLPDGSAMDAEGYLWNARYYAGCVIRISPTGIVDRTVPLPVLNPTTCAFGGPSLETLYITSARCGSRLSGSIFAMEPEVGGIPDGKFRLR